MDWYYGSEINDFLVPEDQDLLDRHPSPDNWSNWEINPSEGFNSTKKFVIMDFVDDDSLSNQIGLEFCVRDKNRSSSSSTCGGLPEQSFQQAALSCDHPNYQFQALPRFENTDGIFLDSAPEDLPRADIVGKSSNISPENQCIIAPGHLPNDIAASNSEDYLDIKELPIKVSDSLDQCSRDEGMREQSCLEESILKDLEMVIGQFNDKTRVCFRDALYRLARDTEQQHAVRDKEEDLNKKNVMPPMDHNGTLRYQYKKPTESETNCVDRVIANLMFNKMEYNIHGLPSTSSSVNSEQEINGSKNCSALNPAQNFDLQKLPGDGEVPWFGPSNHQSDQIEFGNPSNKSFMLQFGWLM